MVEVTTILLAISAVGTMFSGAAASVTCVLMVRNGRKTDVVVGKVEEIHQATNGMKKELEEKAFQAGALSTSDSIATLSADISAKAAETAATAASVVAKAAVVAADLVATTAAANKP
jgi:hypothetical protein